MNKMLIFTVIILHISGCNSNVDIAIETYLKDNLKDPESLVIYNKKIVENYNDISYWVMLDYGAKNGFGGMVRTTEYFYIIGNAVMEVVSEDDFSTKRDRYDPAPVDTVTVSLDDCTS